MDGKPDRQGGGELISNDLMALQRVRSLPASELPLSVAQLRDLLGRAGRGRPDRPRRQGTVATDRRGRNAARAAAARLNLLCSDDEGPVIEAARATLEAFPAAAADYQSGKKAAIGRSDWRNDQAHGWPRQPGSGAAYPRIRARCQLDLAVPGQRCAGTR